MDINSTHDDNKLGLYFFYFINVLIVGVNINAYIKI